MSSSAVVSLSSFNLLFFTQVLTVLTSSIKYNEYVTDKGKNISIPCIADGDIMWVKEDMNDSNNNTIIQTGKFLMFTNVSKTDQGIYVCFASVPQNNTADLDLEGAVKEEEEIEVVKVRTTPANKHSPSMSQNTSMSTTHMVVESSQSASPSNLASTTTSPLTPPLPLPTSIPTRATTSTSETTNIVSSLSNRSNKTIETTTQTTTTATTRVNNYIIEEQVYQAFQRINLTVRTPPGPVTQLYFKASTILGFLIWRFNKTNSGGYPLRSFTAEFRNISYIDEPFNSSMEHKWIRMDPINIAPNVRQMEVYHLAPNTTYEFRIWANNQLGSGEVVTTNVTTLQETKEEDLIRLIQPDLDNFDPRVWMIAVSIVLGTLVILGIGLCIVLSKECYQSTAMGIENSDSCLTESAVVVAPVRGPSASNATVTADSELDIVDVVVSKA